VGAAHKRVPSRSGGAADAEVLILLNEKVHMFNVSEKMALRLFFPKTWNQLGPRVVNSNET